MFPSGVAFSFKGVPLGPKVSTPSSPGRSGKTLLTLQDGLRSKNPTLYSLMVPQEATQGRHEQGGSLWTQEDKR